MYARGIGAHGIIDDRTVSASTSASHPIEFVCSAAIYAPQRDPAHGPEALWHRNIHGQGASRT